MYYVEQNLYTNSSTKWKVHIAEAPVHRRSMHIEM